MTSSHVDPIHIRYIESHTCARYGAAGRDDQDGGSSRLAAVTALLSKDVPGFTLWRRAYRPFLRRFCASFRTDDEVMAWFAAAAIPAARAKNAAGYLVRLVQKSRVDPAILNPYHLLSEADAAEFRARSEPRFVGLRTQDLAVIGWTIARSGPDCTRGDNATGARPRPSSIDQILRRAQ